MNKVCNLQAFSSENLKLINNINQEPPYCECARIGSRALLDGRMPLLRPISSIFSFLDRNNLQAEHQHIIFEQSRDNIGLMGKNGGALLFTENTSEKDYHFRYKECLDGSAMRQAISETGTPQEYRWFGFNCQAYIEKVMKAYRSIVERQEEARFSS